MAPPTGLENAHVPCIGVTLLWRAKKTEKNNLLEAGRMKLQMGKNSNIMFLLSRRSSIGIFFSQAREVEFAGPS